jgi:pyruvate/2-oxoglutarate dehydrogenase complex dihydrolipoamide acyltransferase (E2) component
VSYSSTDEQAPGTVEVTMPETGSPEGAAVVAWLKQPGEQVEAEEPICLVAWDEVTAQVTSPAAGVMRMLALAPGHRAHTGGSLAIIDLGVGGRRADPAPGGKPASEEPAVATAPVEDPARAVPEDLLREAPVSVPERSDHAAFLSPAVRRFASEHGVDPGAVEGTGRDRRVTLGDLQRLQDRGGAIQS